MCIRERKKGLNMTFQGKQNIVQMDPQNQMPKELHTWVDFIKSKLLYRAFQ